MEENNGSSFVYAPAPGAAVQNGQPPVYPGVPVQTPAYTDPVLEKKAKMKSAYKRTGWYMVILYSVMSAVSSLVITLAVIPVIINLMMSGAADSAFEALENGNFLGYYEELMQVIQNAMYSGSIWITLGLVGGSALGIVAGMLLAKLVLRRIEFDPPAKKNLSVSGFLFYLAAALGMWGIGVYTGNIPAFIGLRGASDGISQFIGDNILLYSLYAVIGAPVFEELACRKLLLDRLRGFGEAPAAFVTALLFGLFHGNSGQFFLAFNVGLIFAIVYLKTGRVIYTMALHACINLLGSLDGILYTFGVESIGPVSLDYLTMIICAVCAVLGLVFLIVTRKSERYKLPLTGIPDANRCIFKNAGMLIVVIYSMATIIGMDLLNLVINITDGRGVLSLAALIPTAFFIPLVIVLLKKIGTKHTIPEAPVPASSEENV